MACYIPRWYTRPKTVTHPCTNRARRASTSFMRQMPLTTTPRRQPSVSDCLSVCLSHHSTAGFAAERRAGRSDRSTVAAAGRSAVNASSDTFTVDVGGCTQTCSICSIGADFHRAMVATAPEEKLFIVRRPVRNWTRRTMSSLLFVQKITFVLRKINKNCCHQSCTF